MAVFSVPADFCLDSIASFAQRNSTWDIPTVDVYGSLRSAAIGSGRRFQALPDVDAAAFSAYLDRCAQLGIEFNYTLNTSCLGNREFTREGQDELLAHITALVEAGASRFTVALPTIIALLERAYPEVPVTVSVIAGIDSISRAAFFCRYSNVKCLYLHEAVNRKPRLLRELAAFCHDRGKQIGTMVNTSCLLECPQRANHYNFESHATCGSEYVVSGYYGSVCALEKYAEPAQFLRAPWIRPDDVDRYLALGVDRFKVSGREFIARGADFIRVVDAYNSRRWQGDLVDLFMCFTGNKYSDVLSIENTDRLSAYLNAFFDRVTPCSARSSACSECGHCARNADLVQIDREAERRWSDTFHERIGALLPVEQARASAKIAPR